MSRGSNMVASAENFNKCLEIWASAELKPVICGSATGFKFYKFGPWVIKLLDNITLSFLKSGLKVYICSEKRFILEYELFVLYVINQSQD